MDAQGAVAEARRRWGERAVISNGRLDSRFCLVGVLTEQGSFDVHGSGPNWDAAFADADARSQGRSRAKRRTGRDLCVVTDPGEAKGRRPAA